MSIAFPPEVNKGDPFLNNQPIMVNLGTRQCTKQAFGGPGNGRTAWVCEIKLGDPGESSR